MDWDIEGKQVLITGGNAGIGKATAVELARRGAAVTITVRDRAKGRVAVDEIGAATGVEVAVAELDLSRLDSVRAFVAAYRASHDRLDVLVNNAGMLAGPRRETIDGFEWTIGVNHLGPFLVTNLLLELLRASTPSRIVNVASEAHRSARGGPDLDDLHLAQGYSGPRAYAASKAANILFTVELHRRLGGTGVTAVAVHPGVVATSFGTGSEGPWWMRPVMWAGRPFLRSPAKGAETSVFAATAAEAELARARYWADCAPRDPLPSATDPDRAARLWALSQELVGLAP
jgi:NAD(P)-dependent dehydrogenase (short-subunit alcohol dehydrogenase family)